jgi:hypothetical protein
MSAFVCPGSGQFMQGRVFAGAVYLVVFLIAFVLFAVSAGRILVAYYSLISSNPAQTPDLPLVSMLAWFGFAILVHLINIVDVVAVHIHRHRQHR